MRNRLALEDSLILTFSGVELHFVPSRTLFLMACKFT